ncbi:Dcp2, box A domain-containing protein [Xylariales sp. PMI_506]|nr:Dcp2, box A domain-containing protein [Xylariales sp. PMI_506]
MDQEQMTLEDWLDDLCVRFIINLPQEDLMSVARICFQVEEAHWFYEDFIRALDPSLPHMHLHTFCLRMFQHCPLLAGFGVDYHQRAYEEFMQYKTRVPVRGAIMLNHAMDSTVLVRGWKKGSNWSFPRGKINKDEDDLDCAIREVYEETGFDIQAAGLVPEDRDVKYIEVTMQNQHLRLYVFRDVPMDTVFEPKTRNEIGKIQWYSLQDLPAFRNKKGARNDGKATNANKFYMVAPFLVPLKKWVVQQKKKDSHRASGHNGHVPLPVVLDEAFVEDDMYDTQGWEEPAARPVPNNNPPGAVSDLQRLFNAAHASQFPVTAASQGDNRGAALLSMLQTKDPHATEVPESNAPNQFPHTPMDHTFVDAPQPHTPHHHHHHPVQRLQYPGHEQPPQFPIPANMQQAAYYHQQFQARPQVHMMADASGHNVHVMARQPQNAPQLLHPQPQPPQVQQSLLMRDILGTPRLSEHQQSVRPLPAGQNAFQQQQQRQHQHQQPNPLAAQEFSQTQRMMQQQLQPQPHSYPQQPQSQPQPQPQPSSHSMDLLNIFKTNTAQAAATQLQTQSRPMPPTDKHRSGLLDMFKQGPMGGNDDNMHQNASPAPSHTSNGAPNPAEKHRTTADALRAAVEENGRPLVINPEYNLPFGALSIASRPKATQASPKQVSSTAARKSSFGAQPSPTFSNKPSPGYTPSGLQRMESANRPSSRHSQISASRRASQSNTRPNQSLGYPYGNITQEPAGTNPSFSRSPDVSALPLPNILKSRRESTVEQKSQLLSLFGKNNKGKEPAELSDTANMRPKSRVASIVSGFGDGPASRRGSQTTPTSSVPLSSADQQFLLKYLHNASKAAPY